jgi:predicted ABC-type ATPase
MSMHWSQQRPIVAAIAGPNGAGKTTFFYTHVQPTGLRFVNADVLVRELNLDDYVAGRLAGALRRELVNLRESFAFETVFSDPVRDKLTFLKQTAEVGYSVVLCFVGLESAAMSRDRVAMRVSHGGHDVPVEKLMGRFPRTLSNLKSAICELPHVLVFDNSDLARPFRQVAAFDGGEMTSSAKSLPAWFLPLV